MYFQHFHVEVYGLEERRAKKVIRLPSLRPPSSSSISGSAHARCRLGVRNGEKRIQCSGHCAVALGKLLTPNASVNKQYNLVPAKAEE